MEPVGNSLSTTNIESYFANAQTTGATEETTQKKDSAEISNTSKVLNKVEQFMNLGSSDRLSIDDLSPSEKKEFLTMLSKLIKNGYMGYEVLDINGRPEKHDIDMEIGDQRIVGSKLYKKDNYDSNKL
jgi:hypothetical protein